MLRIRSTSQQPYAKLVEIISATYKLLNLALFLSVGSASVSNLDFSPICTKCLDPLMLKVEEIF